MVTNVMAEGKKEGGKILKEMMSEGAKKER